MSAQTSGPGSAPVDAVASGSEPGMSGPELTVNVPLLRKAVEWAEAEAAKLPELCEWHQGAYFIDVVDVCGLGRSNECGSCYCIAGFIASQQMSLTYFNSGDAPRIAADALGLTYDAAWRLFWSSNTIEDVRRIAESLAGERL